MGGFSLSPLAQKEYLKRKGKKAYFYERTKYSFRDGVDEYERIDEPQDDLFVITVTEDLGKTISDDLFLSPIFHHSDIERNDPDLVAVVEELKDEANGRCAKLSIIEIPDDIEWEIDEYDGREHIDEKHKSWY